MNILKLFKGAKFDYDQIKEENVIKNGNYLIFVDHLNIQLFSNIELFSSVS